MNRREAIAALTSLPGLTRIQEAKLEPDDVLVMEFDGYISAEGAANIRRQMESVWPGRRVVILQRGMQLKVVKG